MDMSPAMERQEKQVDAFEPTEQDFVGSLAPGTLHALPSPGLELRKFVNAAAANDPQDRLRHHAPRIVRVIARRARTRANKRVRSVGLVLVVPDAAIGQIEKAREKKEERNHAEADALVLFHLGLRCP